MITIETINNKFLTTSQKINAFFVLFDHSHLYYDFLLEHN